MIFGLVLLAAVLGFVAFMAHLERRQWTRTLRYIRSLPEREPNRKLRS